MKIRNTAWCQEFWPSSILMGYRGSQAHGTFRPSTDPDSIDDIDIMSVQVHPKSAYLGFGCQETFERFEDPWDVVAYDVRHFVRLLCKQNPNVLSMLWLEPNYYQKISAAGQILIDNRDAFVSKEAHKSFKGYAYSQLHKMTNNACQGYMGAKRKQLVEKHGYDTKNASHLIRLLRMNVEFLASGRLNVMREDNTYLVEIKKGAYTLDQVKAEADRLFALADEAFVRSKLPETVDRSRAEEILIRVIETQWEESRPLHGMENK